MLNGIAIVTGLLLLAAGLLAQLHARRVDERIRALEHAALPPGTPVLGPRRGLLARLFASAEHPDHVARTWLKPLAVALAGVLFGQLLTIGGCNTTPTQQRLTEDEARLAKLEGEIVPRAEHEAAAAMQARANDQREQRIRHLEDQVGHLYDILLTAHERSR